MKSVDEISASLNLSREVVKGALRELIKAKKVKRVSGKLFTAFSKPTTISEEAVGILSLNREGYGFVESDGRGDVFVPPSAVNSALNGDTVSVSIAARRGRLEGRVAKVLNRARTEVVGRYYKNGVVIPISRSYIPPIMIDEEYQSEEVLLIKITLFPDNGGFLKGRAIKKLGLITDIGIENLIVMENYGLTRSFPDEVEQLAASLAAKPISCEGRRDFRGLFTATIDGEDARDFDDAISVEKAGDRYTLYVHIADVSNYVREGSALDEEGYKRGTSVYFPEFAIPMLPISLSNEICSLIPNKDRYAVTVKIEYDGFGKRGSVEFYPSVINSDYRLTYTYVNEVLSEGAAVLENAALSNLISIALELSTLIGKRRKDEGM
ncbi:MAG: RNB domain-containing ribonuclease, partial [Deferribacteraceae bacterium]|nr:RNB domain-containing ribonuclease [Deferribacteraceae bacterium]